MKMIKLIPVIALTVLLASCGAKNAQEFNNKLVTAQKSLMEEVNKMKMDTADALIKLQRVQDVTKTKLKEITDLKAPDGGDAFKKAMMNDFQGIIDSYAILIQMVKEKDNADQQAVLKDKLSDWQTKIEVLDRSVIDEQKKFADKYNIKLQ